MLSKVQSVLATMLAPGEPVLAGVSGGADSVTLLDVLMKLGWKPHVCHLNHQLRGKESDEDAEFVRRFAHQYGVPCVVESRDVAAFANEQKLSLEDAARRARHEFFASVSKKTGIAKLALAHTADDQAETFLLRLLRGSGSSGLTGILEDRQLGTLRVIRPLLRVRRAEILRYLAEQKLDCRTDSSNADMRFTRNRVRHELLPLLERDFNPSIRDVLSNTTVILGDEELYWNEQVVEPLYSAVVRDGAVNVREFLHCHVAVQRRILRRWLAEESDFAWGLGFARIEAVRQLALSDSPSAELNLPGDQVVFRQYDCLKKKLREAPASYAGTWKLELNGMTEVQELGLTLVSQILPQPPAALSGSDAEYFDADSLGGDLYLRTWQEADRFQPLGMAEEKKLQDFFVDEKVPRPQRNRIPLLCAAGGRIAWVVGYRIAEPFKVTGATRRTLRIRIRR